MNFALGEVLARAHVALPARLLQVRVINHRTRIRRRQDVVHAVTTRTVRDDLRSHLRRETVIAVLVTGYPTTRNAELLRQRHGLMALRAAIGSHGSRRLLRISIKGLNDVVYSVTVRAHRRARHTADDGLA